jgi:hypothetical protein
MLFLRVFAATPEWPNVKPKLSKLLNCLEIREDTDIIQTVSVFSVTDALEELAVASALIQCDQSKPEKRHGIRIHPRDCSALGIDVDPSEKGETGVATVDGRHVNLRGTSKQFIDLITLTMVRVWKGEDCMRTFPGHAIAGQLAVFQGCSKLVDEAARERCKISLSKVQHYIGQDSNNDAVHIVGHFEHKTDIPIRCVRSISEYIANSDTKWWSRALKSMWEQIKQNLDRGK